MQNKIKGRALSALLLATLLFASPATLAKTSFLLDSFVLSPYSNPYSKNDGVCSAIIKAAFSKLDTNVEIAYYPVLNSLEQLKQMKTTGVFPVYNAADLEGDIVFTDTIIPIRFFKYTMQTTPLEQEFEGGHAVPKKNPLYCVPQIFKFVKGLQDLLLSKSIQTIQYEQYAQSCYIKLRLGEVDAVIDEEKNAAFAMSYIFEDNALHVHKSAKPIYEGDLFLILNKALTGVQDIVKTFNTALADMKSSGEYNQIIRLFNEEWAIEE